MLKKWQGDSKSFWLLKKIFFFLLGRENFNIFYIALKSWNSAWNIFRNASTSKQIYLFIRHPTNILWLKKYISFVHILWSTNISFCTLHSSNKFAEFDEGKNEEAAATTNNDVKVENAEKKNSNENIVHRKGKFFFLITKERKWIQTRLYIVCAQLLVHRISKNVISAIS